MNVRNVHERAIHAPHAEVGRLIDSLASPQDAFWPGKTWPRMHLDRPLAIGARGGHGPIRYLVEDYAPGRSVRFRFIGPSGFNGHHGFECIDTSPTTVTLRHTLQMDASGLALLSWSLIFRPLHDALIEDSLATAEASIGQTPTIHRWSRWVRLLRWLLS